LAWPRLTTCDADLSGQLSAWSEENYNDVTNIQLLCGPCNRRKGSRRIVTSSSYEDWYPYPKD